MDVAIEFVFQTPRLIVRNFAPQDWRRLQAFGGRPEVARMMAYLKSPWPDKDVKAWMMRAPYCGKLGFGAGVYHSNDKLIGFVRIGGDPAICAFAIDPDYWGVGFATEALNGLLNHSFTNLGLEFVEADHFNDNPASGRVLLKQGFVKIGASMGSSAARLEPAPNTLYRLTKSQFKAANQ